MQPEPTNPPGIWDWIAHRRGDLRLQAKIRTACSWISREGESPLIARTELNNLALAHAGNLGGECQWGLWSESQAQLLEVAAAADLLASHLKRLSEGARVLVSQGAENEATQNVADVHGLISQWVEAPSQPKDGRLTLQLSDQSAGPPLLLYMESDPPLVLGQTQPPRWIARTEALAACCRAGATLAGAKGHQRGRSRVATDWFGSAELQLIHACAELLRKKGSSGSRILALARIVEHLVRGEGPSVHWGKEAYRQFARWWLEVRDWIDRPTDAEEAIQILLKKGPQAMPKRRPTKRSKP